MSDILSPLSYHSLPSRVNCHILQILNVDVSPIAILNNLRTAVSTADAAVRRAALNTVRLGSMAVEPEIIQARVDWLRREGININRDPFTANKRKLMGVVTSNVSTSSSRPSVFYMADSIFR
jgi:hypothetical protein